MEYYIKKAFPGWKTLGGIGNSKVIRSFSIWFLVIPILAKVTEKISGPISLGLSEPPIVINWEMPFSLQVLYLATIFFTIANILYITLAPSIVKEYRSFLDFKEKEGSFEALKQMFEPLLVKSDESYREMLLGDFLDHVPHQVAKDVCPRNKKEKFDVCTVSSVHHSEAFANIKGAYNEEQKLTQLIIFSLYMFGFLCILYLFIENCIYVFGSWF